MTQPGLNLFPFVCLSFSVLGPLLLSLVSSLPKTVRVLLCPVTPIFLVNLFFSGSLNLSTVALIAFCNVCTGILQDGGTGGGITAATCINGTVTAATKAVVEAAGTRLARWLVPRAAAMAIRLVRSGSNA